MAGPWEKYAPAQAAAPAAAGPWDKYAAPAQTAAAAPAAPAAGTPDDIEEEMHPQFSAMDRFVVKNFGNDAKASASYLKKKHPELDIKVGQGDRILAKAQGESKWRPLDPDNGFVGTIKRPGELLQDIGDVGVDLTTGALSGAATAAGGIAGAATGPGALAAASAAGGLSSAGLETGRQAIGRALGVNDELKSDDILASGVVGAASPLLFGTGATGGQAAKAALKTLGADAGEEALAEGAKAIAKNQRGGLGYLRDGVTGTVLPKVGEMLTGIDKDAIKTYASRAADVHALEKTGVTDFVSATHENLQGALNEAKNQVGSKIANALDSAGAKIDLTKARAPLENLLSTLEQRSGEINNPALAEKIKNVKNTLQDIFHQPGEAAKPAGLVLDASGKPAVAAVEATGPRLIDKPISARSAFELRQDLADVAELGKSNDGLLSRLFKKTSFEKQLGEAARQSYSLLGDEINNVTKQVDGQLGTKELNAQYKRMADIQKNLAPYFSSPERTYNTLRNLKGKPKRMLREQLAGLDKEFGTDTGKSADLLQALSTFSNAPFDAVGGGGVTSTSRSIPLALAGSGLGYYAGAHSDLGQGGAGIGAVLGGALGAKAGSPAMVRAIMDAYRASKSGAGLLARPAQFAPASAWNAVAHGGEQP